MSLPGQDYSITPADMAEILITTSGRASPNDWEQYANDVRDIATRNIIANTTSLRDAVFIAKSKCYAAEVAKDYLRVLEQLKQAEAKDPRFEPPEIGEACLVLDKESGAVAIGYLETIVEDKDKKKLNWQVYGRERIYEVSLWMPLPTELKQQINNEGGCLQHEDISSMDGKGASAGLPSHEPRTRDNGSQRRRPDARGKEDTQRTSENSG